MSQRDTAFAPAARPQAPSALAATPGMSANAQRIVLCMKWGSKYGPEYVNRLYGMVRRHLTGEFRFVCLTDDASGVRAEVTCLPLPSLELAPGADRGWPKLTTFKADLHGLSGRALFMDLDIVIVDRIDAFFEQPGDFLIIHDWKRPWRVTGNSSVYRFQIGAHADILQRFVQHQDSVRKRYRNEQEFLSHALHEQGKLAYWPRGWCRSFKYHCIPRWPASRWQAPAIPAGARILIFHGEINPPDALVGGHNRHGRAFKPAPWIADLWQE